MPNVYGLRQTELLRKVNQEDPESTLDGVAASGLVGILRQIGDLTEFAAEIFHGIQEEVMVTASRSSNLKTRLMQLEVTVPSFHKTLLPQPNHIHFAYTAGLEWHPRIPNLQNHFINDDLPQFIMGPYQDCRDPPRLHLLDKFDINGPGSCLKRYSDPTHFKIASNLPGIEMKKCVPQSRAISRLASMPNQSDRKTFTSLSFGGRSPSSKTASTIGIESKSDLQDLPSCSFDSTSVAEKPKGLFTSSRFTRTIASVLSESESESESEDANDSPSQDLTDRGSSCEKAEVVECATDEPPQIMETDTLNDDKTTDARIAEHKAIEAVQDVKRREMEIEMEMDSDGDDFVDALYTIDSESETDQEMEKNSNNLRVVGETKCAAASDRDPSGICNYANGFSNPLYDISGIQEHQESEDETCCDTRIRCNGNLLGPKPSEPKIVAVTNPENDAEPLREDKEAPFEWFTSSPPLDHMKISFNPSETLPSSELKLKLRDEYTFSSFQLVPENAADSDSDKDTFCRSSSYSENHSEQQWEEESGERKSNAAQSPQIERSNYSDGIHSYLQNPAEPLPPPLPPLQWMVSNKKQSLKENLIRELEHKNFLSTINKQNFNIVTASSDPKPVNNVHQKNNLREFSHSHGYNKQTEAGDFLHQIRTKQFKLRRVVTGRTSSTEATTNNNINLILEKANSIRQAVASDDGDGESNTWSDSDT